MRTVLIFSAAFLMMTSALFSDGLMRPSSKAYPGNFLRHRMTKVDVTVNGQIAQTTVYQEFVNEWTSATDVVYSFPLPPDARATALYFWANDTMFRAVLKVKEQAPNPGTGDGGIDAQVNAYLGPNALRMMIPNVPAGSIQRVQLEYISLCNFSNGTTEYHYPMNTTDFVLFPVETFSFTISVSSGQPITASSLQPSSGAVTKQSDPQHLQSSLDRSKTYLTSDLLFTYASTHDSLRTEFYAVDNDTMDGHFVMLLKSPSGSRGNDVFRKNVVFILDRSADMFGASLADAKDAIAACIGKLDSTDSFNLFTFDYTLAKWRSGLNKATAAAKDSAVKYLSTLSYSGSSILQSAIQSAVDQFPSDTTQNIIVLFSDGKAVLNPELVRNYNTKKAAIMTIAGASTAGRQRLEMIAYLNYGIPAFISQNEIMKDRVNQIFDRINLPVMKDVHYEIGSNVHSILPVTATSLYKGSLTYFTGRYKNPGNSVFSIAGFSPSGPAFKDVQLAFPADTVKNKFAEKFWAKEKIDEIERRIAVFGENDSLKKADIAVSLGYGIRCKYTSYNAEKTSPVVPPASSADAVEFISTRLTVNADGTLLQWKVSSGSDVKEFRIYRMDPATGTFVLAAVVSGGQFSWQDSGNRTADAQYRIDAVTPSGAIYSAMIRSSAQSPNSASLYSNYPNPFNPSTIISFDNPVKQHVLLVVHDVTGREICRLTDEQKEAGSYSVSFSSTMLTSGVYFYTLRAGSFVQTKKMTVLK